MAENRLAVPPTAIVVGVLLGERAALLGSLGRLYTLGAEIDWQRLYPANATAIRLPSYPFQADSHWRESETTRRMRIGRSVHPLLGNRLDLPKPSWRVALDMASLSYLVDHRIGDAIIFPGAGYVEMALSAARETFGPVPCVVEDIEFQKFLVLDEGAAPLAQVAFDPATSEFEICSRAEPSRGGWDLHAKGCVRPWSGPALEVADIEEIRRRCPEAFDQRECNIRFAECGYHYGPTFQGITRLWRSEREVLAEALRAEGGERRENDQGVGYLEDGTMVVVEGGKSFMDRMLNVTVTKFINTNTGRMFFAVPEKR